METLEERLSRLEKISSNYSNEDIKKEYIYIILPNSVNKNKTFNDKIIKIGKTRNVMKRFFSYEKNSILVYLCRVKNCSYIKNAITVMMRNYYKKEKKYGDIIDITYCINKLIENENKKIKTDEDTMDRIKENYKNHLTFSFVDYVNIINKENYNYERYNSK